MGVYNSNNTNSNNSSNSASKADGYANMELKLADGTTIKFKGYNPLSTSNDAHAAMIEAELAEPGQVFMMECRVHVIDHEAAPKSFVFAKA